MRLALVISAAAAIAHGPALGAEASPVAKAFVRPELIVDTAHIAASHEVRSRLVELAGPGASIYIDPRSGTPSSLVLAVPFVPGSGAGNVLTLDALSSRLGRRVDRVDAQIVSELLTRFVMDHAETLAIDAAQVADARATRVTPELWHVRIPQQVKGIPVRHAHLSATLSHGNLVLLGTERWGNARLDTQARVPAARALETALRHLGGGPDDVEIWRQPRLEIVPFGASPAQAHSGYGHYLAWSIGLHRKGQLESWEALVDAHDGALLAFDDRNLHDAKSIVGGIYPLTNTGVCPTDETCGTMVSGEPMPYADTGFPAPHQFTNASGVYPYFGGTVTTRLDGKYVRVVDACGPIAESSAAGALDLGGTNGDHDCASGGVSAGNTAAARSGFHALNRIVEMARGWLPLNPWLQGKITLNVNVAGSCGAFYSPANGSINFLRTGGSCRNSGEIASIVVHEWGHALDDNDSGGALSNSSEAYADIVAIYRLRASCVGYGFYSNANAGCGMTADGTGFNANEAMVGSYCTTNCSGVRDCDWDRHASGVPATALGFVCTHCSSGSGPCGKQPHCAASPARQAAWDLVARDLQAPPSNMTAEDAFNLGAKLFYQGSGNIGAWHACTCGASSNGCGATNAYMQWLAADDDDGDLSNGTPHMTAIFAAFDRHGLACPTPVPTNSGCGTGPTLAPVVSILTGDRRVELSWPAVPAAVSYRILRSDGHGGCDAGKAVIAEVNGTSYLDADVVNDRPYSYVVQAVGTSGSCMGPGSPCTQALPAACSGEGCAPPGEVLWLQWDDRAFLSWSSTASIADYIVYRGAGIDVVKLATNEPDSCARLATAVTQATALAETPAPGAWTWWLVRAANSSGLGPAGSSSLGPRLHDPAGACP